MMDVVEQSVFYLVCSMPFDTGLPQQIAQQHDRHPSRITCCFFTGYFGGILPRSFTDPSALRQIPGFVK